MLDCFLKLEANNLKTILSTKIVFLIHKFKCLKLQFRKENSGKKSLWGRGGSPFLILNREGIQCS